MSRLLPVVRDWADWRAVFGETEVWRGAVAEIAERHALADGEITAGYPGTCAVFALADRAVVKLFPPMCADDAARELYCYRKGSERVALMPRLLANGVLEDRIAWPYLVTEFVRGEAIRDVFESIPPAQRLDLARAVAQSLKALHDIPVEGDHRFRDWADYATTAAAGAERAHLAEGCLSEAVCAEIGRYVQEADLVGSSGRPRLLHGDLTEDHLLVRQAPDGWSPAGLIDYADAEYGTVDYEWGVLWLGMFNRDAGMMNAFVDEYGDGIRGDADWRRRVAAWIFAHRFGPGIVAGELKRAGSPRISRVDQLVELTVAGIV